LCWQRPGDHLGCMQLWIKCGGILYGEWNRDFGGRRRGTGATF
jgi:hypothetical protein